MEVCGMIHRDFCNPGKTKYYSALRMQFHFLISRYVCWDGLIPLTRLEMARYLSCNIQSVHKFIKKGVLEGMFSLNGNRLYLLTRVDNYSGGYVKHFPFLESDRFKSLSIHAQRFILYTLWTGVHTGRPLKRDITSLYHSTPEFCGVLNLYSRTPVYSVLEETTAFLKLEIIDQKGKEFVRVAGLHKEFSQESAFSNQGELKLLEDILQEHYCDELISPTTREEILKLKSYYFRTLSFIGIELFSHALEKLLSLHKIFELDKHHQVGAYLKSIIQDMEKKILPTLKKRIIYCKQAITKSKTIHFSWINQFEEKLQSLIYSVNLLVAKQQKTHSPPIVDQPQSNFPFFNWLET
jgi:hypothetical protein